MLVYCMITHWVIDSAADAADAAAAAETVMTCRKKMTKSFS